MSSWPSEDVLLDDSDAVCTPGRAPSRPGGLRAGQRHCETGPACRASLIAGLGDFRTSCLRILDVVPTVLVLLVCSIVD